MSNYRRANVPGAAYFFTVVTYRRQRFLCDDNVRSALRDGITKTRMRYPFEIDAWVLLPDHLHCIWTLPAGDADFGKRWSMIKRYVTKQCGHLKRNDWVNESKQQRGESTLWQRRFWEHQIRNEHDFENHMNYIHHNPVKHGHVQHAHQWPYSTFHRYVNNGTYPNTWGGINENTDASHYGDV